jgi:fucose permease
MDPRYWHYMIFYLSAFLQGIALITFSASGFILTDVSYHHLSPAEFGSIFLPLIIGMLIASFAAARQAPKKGFRTVYVAGLFCNAVALFLFTLTSLLYREPSELLFLLNCSLFCVGAGFGATFTILNTYIARYFPWKIASAMNLLYMFFGMGSTVSPLLLAGMLKEGIWWVDPLIQMILFLALIALTYALLPENLPPELTLETDEKSKPPLVQPPPFKFYLISIFLYGLCETIIGNTATIYLYADKGLSIHQTAIGLTLFWGMATVGRGMSSFLTLRYSPSRIYAVLPWILVVSFALLPFSSGVAMDLLVFALAGFGCSANLPLNISLAEKDFVKPASIISGLLMASYIIGCGVASYGVGILREQYAYSLDSIYSGSVIIALLLALSVGRIFLAHQTNRENV